MHPRQDVTHHPLIPLLLGAGVAVWTQHTRLVNNDLNLVHEQAILDVAAGLVFLRDQGFDSIITLGHSGGGPLCALYLQQAALPPAQRIATTPGGRPTKLADAEMPAVDGAIFLAPHPGQGRPRATRPGRPHRRGRPGAPRPFRRGPHSGQTDRVGRRPATLPRTSGHHGLPHRCDPRTVDLAIDPNERPYRSVFGRRPDLINYGQVGFGRLTTPEAWLSTWSGLSSDADFVRCAPGVRVPTLFIELSGDQAAFPADSRRMADALGASDLTCSTVRGTHFGGPIAAGEPTGNELAGGEIRAWLGARTELTPPP
jgi:acetyl esterase/lipase